MSRVRQISSAKGSLKRMQELVNDYPDLLREAVYKRMKEKKFPIQWVSPLRDDDFAEYRDGDFLRVLKIENIKEPLEEFWPKGGPQWDGLGRSDDGRVFLIEGKANLPEVISPGTHAKSPLSIALIKKSLEKTKTFMGCGDGVDWSRKYYQYTNRLAHLYYLRELNDIDAYLVFIYFVDDKSVNGPAEEEGWHKGIESMEEHLGLRDGHPLKEYILDVFIDVKDMK